MILRGLCGPATSSLTREHKKSEVGRRKCIPMSAVIELDGYRHAWTWGLTGCWCCGHQWMGVAHVENVHELECPACGEMDGSIYHEKPGEDKG